MSISGDKTLRLWNYLNGKELFCLEMSARGLRLVRNSRNELAVVLFDDGVLKIGFFKLVTGDCGPEVHAVTEHVLSESMKYISSIAFNTDDSIWISGLDESNEIILKKLEINRSNDQAKIDFNETDLDDILSVLKQTLTSTKLQACEDITQLFKKSFDNMTDYQERKKRRIEKKHSK